MDYRRIVLPLIAVLSCVPCGALARQVPAATLDVSADAVQPAGAPVLLTLTVHNTGHEPISYWWGGPGDYPNAGEYLASVSVAGEAKPFLQIALSNGQKTDGAGRTRDVPAGHSVSFPAALTPLPAGRYSISVAGQPDGRIENGVVRFLTWPETLSRQLVTVEIREDEKLAAARDGQTIAKVRTDDPFAKHIASTWSTKAIKDALVADLMGDNIAKADRAADGLWGDKEPTSVDAPIVAKAIIKHLKPGEDECDVGLMAKLLDGISPLESLELQNAVARLLVSRPDGRVRRAALSVLNLPLKPKTSETARQTVEQTDQHDPAALQSLLQLATSMDPVQRKIGYQLLGDYPENPKAAQAIRAGIQDTDYDAHCAAVASYLRVTSSKSSKPFVPETQP
jgi:hypothetical protein